MSFSFRNLFSQDESETSGSPADSRREGGEEGRASFLPDGVSSEFQGMRNGESQEGRTAPNTTRFMVNELLPFIPPAIAASNGIPMEQMMDIPLSGDGSRDVKLSTLYQLCPNLFASEITPLNDSVVTLPPRLEEPRGSARASSESAFRPQSASQSNPFSNAESPARGGQAPSPKEQSPFGNSDSSKNPFWSPESDQGPKSPSPAASQKPAEQAFPGSPFGKSSPADDPGASPFSQAPQGEPSSGFQAPNGEAASSGFEGSNGGNAFSHPGPKPAEPAPQQGQAPKQQANPFGSTPQDFGASPKPASDAGEGFSTLFSQQAEKDTEIDPPGHSNSSKNPFANAEISESPFSADTDSGFGIGKENSEAASPSANPFEGTMDAIEAEVDEGDDEFEGYLPPAANEETLSQIPGLMESQEGREDRDQPANDEPVHFDDLMGPGNSGGNESPKSSFFDELGKPPHKNAPPKSDEASENGASKPKAESGGSSFDYATFPKNKPEERPSETRPGQPTPEANSSPRSPFEQVAQSPFSPEEQEQPSGIRREQEPPVAVSPASPSFSSVGSIKHLELRALFGTEEPFTIQNIAGLIAEMGGISSCSISAPNGSARAGNKDGATTGDKSREMARNVRQLAEFSGITDASTFTMQTDQGMVSLFLEGDSCLTVRHDETGFGPGVRERLILVARSLDRIDS